MKKTTTVIFSRNRALQCDLLLRSLLFCCSDILELSDINVLYLAEEEHRESYKILIKEHPEAKFIEETNFKDNFLGLLDNKTNILFLCDDSVFTEKFSLAEVLRALDSDNNYIGFSLRLGANTTTCFPYGDTVQQVPEMENVIGFDRIKTYQWKLGQLDFGYPLEVSSSLFKKETINEFLIDCEYKNPNELEASLVENTNNLAIDNPLILCFDKGVCFSIPVNRVQTYNSNRCGDVSAEDLKKYFMDGKRIDSSPFYKYVNHGAHEIVEFIMVDKYESGM